MRRRAETKVPAGGEGIGSGRQPLRCEGATRHLDPSTQRVLLRSMLEVVGSVGYEEATLGMVLGRAGISRRAFDLEFAGKEDCFLAAFDSVLAETESLLAAAIEEESSWRGRFRNGLCQLLDLLDAQPTLGRVLIVEAPKSGRPGRERWARILSRAAQLIDLARLEPESKERERPPSITADAVVAGIHAPLWLRLANPAKGRIRDLAPDLVHYGVMPYFGHEIADEEMLIVERHLS